MHCARKNEEDMKHLSLCPLDCLLNEIVLSIRTYGISVMSLYALDSYKYYSKKMPNYLLNS